VKHISTTKPWRHKCELMVQIIARLSRIYNARLIRLALIDWLAVWIRENESFPMAKWVTNTDTDTDTRPDQNDTNGLWDCRVVFQSTSQILGQTRTLYQLIKYLTDTFDILVSISHDQLICSCCLLFAGDRKVFGKMHSSLVFFLNLFTFSFVSFCLALFLFVSC